MGAAPRRLGVETLLGAFPLLDALFHILLVLFCTLNLLLATLLCRPGQFLLAEPDEIIKGDVGGCWCETN